MALTADFLRDRMRAVEELPPPSQRRAIRKASGVLVRECAEYLGVTSHTIVNWENGTSKPSGVRLDRYAELLRLLSSGNNAA